MEIKKRFSPFQWHTLPEAVRVYISALEQNIVTLSDKIEPLEKRIEQLEARLNQNSNKSSNRFGFFFFIGILGNEYFCLNL